MVSDRKNIAKLKVQINLIKKTSGALHKNTVLLQKKHNQLTFSEMVTRICWIRICYFLDYKKIGLTSLDNENV